jgi:DNA polymerase I-like protein with 3'-5' exonuclease and polymerase domains
MKKYRRGAFDCSSFMWTMMSWGTDKENGFEVEHEGKKVYINSALYGYDNTLGRMLDCMKAYKLNPIDVILVFEGQNSKGKRLLIDNQYKGGGASSRHPAAYEQFEKLRAMLKQTFLELGAQVLTQDFAEGDDTLGWLAHNTEDDLIVFTFDNDLTVLNLHPNAHGARVSTWINEMFEYNKYGTFDYHLVTTYKALVGDSSDNIKGCPGFGPKKFEALCEKYGYDGLQQIHDMLARSDLSPLGDFIGKDDKLLQLILDNAPQVIRCFDLARVRPEWVNTMRQPLQWEAGMVRQLAPTDRDPRLKPWYGRTRLITGSTFEQAIAWAMPHICAHHEVSLDIETSTPDESDEWLAALGDPDGVDVFGSMLTGLALTFGPNNQYSLYFPVDHADTDNVDSELLRQFIASIPQEIALIIQNVSFELTVLFNEWGARQMDNGYHGFLPNVRDTKFEANYVNENIPVGLKERSHGTLGYRQQTYKETCEITAPVDQLFKGGRLVREDYQYRTVGTGKFEPLTDEEVAAGIVPMEITKPELVEVESGEIGEDGKPVMVPVVATQTRRYKMNELPATHVVGYGVDDTICTIALHNYYKLFMQLEHSYRVYLEVELDAAYQHAKNFIDGTEISVARCKELEREDDITYEKAWGVVRQYLIEQGWAGTSPPVYTVDITPAQIKEAYTIVTGEVLDTMMRTPSKIVTFIRTETEHLQFAEMLDRLVQMQPVSTALQESLKAAGFEVRPPDFQMSEQQLTDNARVCAAEKEFTTYVRRHFKGEPQFNKGSPIQMQRLMYEVMGLPVKVRNMPTEAMKKAGIREGSPKTDLLAVAYGLQDCTPEQKPVLEALKLMGMVTTRRSLYYSKYPYFTHWKDGRVRSQHNQCSTVTRRASESKPNKQQLPKHQKIEGQEAKFREVIVPHRPGAVIVSMDFDSQEMVLIAFQSQDPNALSCFQGEKRKSPHTITGLGIIREEEGLDWTYEDFEAALASGDKVLAKHVKDIRNLGKKVNFTAEYGAMAEKVAATLMIPVERAQLFLDAREAMYPVAQQWKEDIKAEVKENGVVRTLGGGVRHLSDQLLNGTNFEKSKAERQAVNFKVQGPAGEQTKLAEGRMWRDNLSYDFDAVCYGPIHDEVVWSVMIDDLPAFLPRCHAAMTAPFATMDLEVVSTISFGPNFYRQTEIGAYPTPDAIRDGLLEMHLGMIARGETTWEQSWIENEVQLLEAA